MTKFQRDRGYEDQTVRDHVRILRPFRVILLLILCSLSIPQASLHNPQADLSEVLARFHDAVRLARLVEREHAVEDRA